MTPNSQSQSQCLQRSSLPRANPTAEMESMGQRRGLIQFPLYEIELDFYRMAFIGRLPTFISRGRCLTLMDVISYHYLAGPHLTGLNLFV